MVVFSHYLAAVVGCTIGILSMALLISGKDDE